MEEITPIMVIIVWFIGAFQDIFVCVTLSSAKAVAALCRFLGVDSSEQMSGCIC